MLGLLVVPRLAVRLLDDLHALAVSAGDAVQLLASLDETAREVQGQIASLQELADRIEHRIDRLIEVGDLALAESLAIQRSAQEVAQRGAEVAAALPLLERAVALADPLEGTVERLGRIVDRLPGGRARQPRA